MYVEYSMYMWYLLFSIMYRGVNVLQLERQRDPCAHRYLYPDSMYSFSHPCPTPLFQQHLQHLIYMGEAETQSYTKIQDKKTPPRASSGIMLSLHSLLQVQVSRIQQML